MKKQSTKGRKRRTAPRPVKMPLIKKEGEEKVHIRGKLQGRALCDEFMPGAVSLNPLNVSMSEVCEECRVKHLRRKRDTR